MKTDFLLKKYYFISLHLKFVRYNTRVFRSDYI